MEDIVDSAPASLEVSVTVNGALRSASVPPRTTLADYLRDALGLRGTKVACEQGVCGACTVLLDGAAVRSCLVLAVQADGHTVQTVEGLATSEEELSDLQQAFARNDAMQCGFCTSGMLMTAAAILDRGVPVTADEVRETLSGNLCRCTGYSGIVNAVTDVAAARGLTNCDNPV
ncbi:MAG: (2Fe-2S)-binding protein [Actinomycetia bacterium]|nr:(2Fe-2S)-binding protein [Actinomycetes bacterium]